MNAVSKAFVVKEVQPRLRDGRIVNAMSVDVEEYFQVQALAGSIELSSWDHQPSRVEGSTHRILDMFSRHGVRATFFTLAWVAQRCPALIRRIVAEGHELASHGSKHRRADDQSPEQFRIDVGSAKRMLEDIGGVAVRGYRAPTFSIGAHNLWAYEVLADEGYAYSSSVYPTKRDNYGMPSAPRFVFQPQANRGIVEYPLSTVRLAKRNLPCAGGGFFRLLPWAMSRAAIAHVNRRDNMPAIFYFHPWEVDPGQPRVQGLSFKSRFRHYINLDKTEARLERLVQAFPWDRLDAVFSLDAAS